MAAPCKKIRELTGGGDVDIVYEHPAVRPSEPVVRREEGWHHRHLPDLRIHARVRQPVPGWMNLSASSARTSRTTRSPYEANRLIDKGADPPTLSKAFAEETGQAAYEVHRNQHQGKGRGAGTGSSRRASGSKMR